MNQSQISYATVRKELLSFRHLGQNFTIQSHYHGAPPTPLRKVLRFIHNVGLMKGRIRKGSPVDAKGISARAG
jgi:hypothetical protein